MWSQWLLSSIVFHKQPRRSREIWVKTQLCITNQGMVWYDLATILIGLSGSRSYFHSLSTECNVTGAQVTWLIGNMYRQWANTTLQIVICMMHRADRILLYGISNVMNDIDSHITKWNHKPKENATKKCYVCIVLTHHAYVQNNYQNLGTLHWY
jgi:hypothetical protein